MRRGPGLCGMPQLQVSEVPCSHQPSTGHQWQNQMPLISSKLSKEGLTSKSVFQSTKSTRLRGLLGVRLERKIRFWCKPRTWYPFHAECREKALLPQLRFRGEPGRTSCLPGIQHAPEQLSQDHRTHNAHIDISLKKVQKEQIIDFASWFCIPSP